MKHSGVYVDLGYKESTNIVVIKEDAIREIIELSPWTEFDEIVSRVVVLLEKYDLDATTLKAYRFPDLEHRVRSILWKNPSFNVKPVGDDE